jgi:hypothetical protein
MAFSLFHAYHLPQLSIDSSSVKKLSAGLKQIDLIIRNDRVLPTRSAHEIKNKITRPDIVSISGKNMTVIAGFLVEDPYLLIASEQKYQPQDLKVETIDGMGTVHLRWIVKGDRPFDIKVDSYKGGILKTTM